MVARRRKADAPPTRGTSFLLQGSASPHLLFGPFRRWGETGGEQTGFMFVVGFTPMQSDAKDRKWLRWASEGAAIFSTCAKAQYLAVIVDARGRVVSTGYNGSPPGFGHCNEGACPRMAEGSASGSSYDNCLAVHAEANALVHGDAARFAGATLYVNGMPCFGCAKMIAGAGIARVVYTDGSVYPGTEDLFAQAGIVLVGLDLEGSTDGTE